ncbi:MAG: HlyD family efflux transporter periplasmic adaptor subunit [Sporolactobacillus sp.]
MRKAITIAVVIIVLAAAGGLWFLTRGRTAAAETLYPVTTVKKGTLKSSVSASGTLKPVIDEDVAVGSGDAGKTISTVDVAAGNVVQQGTALLTYTDGTTLTAPDTGTVTAVNANVGDRVATGKVIAHLTNYSDLEADVQVDELDIPKVAVGQAVDVTVNAFPDQSFTGTISSIANAGTENDGTASFDVLIQMNAASQLKAGMTLTADIIQQQKTNVLYVPTGAVHKDGSKYYVYVSSGSSSGVTSSHKGSGSFSGYGGFARGSAAISGGYVRMDKTLGKMVEVQVGIHNDTSMEITSGLQESEAIQLPAITRQSSTTSTTGVGQGSYRSMMGGGQGFGGGGRTQTGNRGGGGL